MSLIFAFRQPFFGPDDLEYVAKTGAVEIPLTAIWRGATLPYFGKISKNVAYSPQELKRADYRSFLVGVGMPGTETEPVWGLFSSLREYSP
jgi:hypothetical protein